MSWIIFSVKFKGSLFSRLFFSGSLKEDFSVWFFFSQGEKVQFDFDSWPDKMERKRFELEMAIRIELLPFYFPILHSLINALNLNRIISDQAAVTVDWFS